MSNKHAERTTEKLVKLLKEKRLAKGLSHQTLADIAKVNRSTISRIESGERVPTITVCFKVAEALELKLHALIKQVDE